MLDVFSMVWVGKRLVQGTAVGVLPIMIHDPAYSSETPRGSQQARLALLSS